MKNHEDSWKNKKVFEAQLALNEKELDTYPFHWQCLLKGMSFLKSGPTRQEPKSFLDLGCGCGVFSKLVKRHFPTIEYKGLDYADEAIEVASKRWGIRGLKWEVKSYKDLSEEDLNFDILHAGAMLDVLPNADEALKHLCELGFTNLIFGRMKLIEEDSRVETYEAYDLITTYAFYHKQSFVHETLQKNGYNYVVLGYPDNATIVASKQELILD
tara:strand:+ start:8489 stop:9130 length:642 start_codon:yes stop_codon:yes gene_type:complete